jgi:cytochrome c oxidase subunit 2
MVMSAAAPAFAGQPTDGAINFQAPATGSMRQIVDFHNFILPIIVVITLLVLALLAWVMIRYNRWTNPTPRKFTHNTLVEVIWTVVPVLILVVIAIRSFPILHAQERAPPAAVTIKVTASSWAWAYEYQDLGVTVNSNLLPEDQAVAQQRPYLLAVDNPIYVPVGENVQVLISSNDVIHSWTVPAFGVKQDAIQGRTNVGWFNVERAGTYYGQCSELCGINHAYMPIEVRAVPRAEFERWIVEQGGSLEPPAEAAAETAPAAAPAEAAPADAAPAQP